MRWSINDGNEMTLNATNLSPGANDGNALGVSGTGWADIFLASGAVIDFDAGDVTLTHAANALDIAGGDFNVAVIDGQTVNIDGDGTPTADLLKIGNGDTTSSAIDGLDITLTTANGASGTSLLNLNPTFASTANNSTHFAMNIANITATSTTNTLIARGINIGNMSEAGNGFVTSTAIQIGSGWDTVFNGSAITIGSSLDTEGTLTFDATGSSGERVCQSGGGTGDGVSLNEARLVDCSASGQADYAEMYPVASGITYADIVVLGTRTVTTKKGDQITEGVLSATPYQHQVVGIVSDNYEDPTSAGYNIREEDHPMPVALVGRVPVKVTDENGPIVIGDFLTTSSTPGHAMRATRKGRVIGVALAQFTGTEGTVMVQVMNTWYDPGTDTVTTVAASDGSLIAPEDLNLEGKRILNVAAITSANGSWSIDEGGHLVVRQLTVGTSAAPTGITLYDESNGSPYCVFVRSGALLTRPGECGATASATTPTTASTSVSPPPETSTLDTSAPVEPAATSEPTATDETMDSAGETDAVVSEPVTTSAPATDEAVTSEEATVPDATTTTETVPSDAVSDSATAPSEPVTVSTETTTTETASSSDTPTTTEPPPEPVVSEPTP